MARSALTIDRPPDEISQIWRELEMDGTLTFRAAPADWGTVVTLEADLPGTAADKLLRQLKAFAETGEVPTTDRNPSARADAATT